jgi:hypothetical protein
MMNKKILRPDRLRQVPAQFSWVAFLNEWICPSDSKSFHKGNIFVSFAPRAGFVAVKRLSHPLSKPG